MFEAAELGQKISREVYDAELPKLRAKLLNAHLELRAQKFPVIVIVSGADGGGKGETVHRLNEWLDPRGVQTHAFWEASDEERERPSFWRFWRAMPGRGRIGIFFGSWYTGPIIQRVYGDIKRSRLDTELDRIVAFEKMLTDEGALIVKLWLHLSKKAQKRALGKLERMGRLGPEDWKHFKMYDRFTRISERALRHTHTGFAPWQVIEAADRRYRELTIGRILLAAIEQRGKTEAGESAAKAGVLPPATSVAVPAARKAAAKKASSILAHVDLTQRLTDAQYGRALEDLQAKLSRLAWAAREKRRSMVMVFEGWDAAGKGSAIRRVTQAVDPRLYRVVGIAAPTEEERAQHYLWRFWRHLPRAGYTTIFDRSWYGRVLVERVEGFASVPAWSRAYHEINEFEEQLSEHGIVVNKFWLQISPEEQLRRFEERQRIDYKQYKITEEDWRNREKWDAYQIAVDDMVARCSTEFARWTLVAANDKKFARVQILKTIVERLAAAL
ncbi:MAG: polyphosphate:AMP phosphotransferase [Verrucomicrobia bacterium]|nr:polyphosphate:AMP phosphotransferase [Verrucomicrobiota bacterium]